MRRFVHRLPHDASGSISKRFPLAYRVDMPAPLTAGEILEATIEDGREELGRGSVGLALSGLGAGLNVSFAAAALGGVGALTGGVWLLAFAA